MPVGQKVAFDPVFVLKKVIEPGNDVIDARHRLVRLAEAAFDDEEVAVDVDAIAILPFLIESA